MKVLVTGGAGFLGSHICEHYIRKGWDVIAYDNLTKYELLRTGYNVEGARDYNVDFLKGIGVDVQVKDIRDIGNLSDAARDCDYIIHTAAQPAMTIAIEDPSYDFDVNARGLLNVLEVARKYNLPLVNCSTIHIYGCGINEYLVEDDRYYIKGSRQDIDEEALILTGTLTPLHASKRAGEIYARTYTETYGVRIANFRLSGLYGTRQLGGEDHGWVANFAIRTLLGLPIKVFGTDKQVRDILYVTDAAEAFDKWYQAGCLSGTYNIGGGVPTITSIRDCLSILRGITGKDQDICIEPSRKGDLYYFCCDVGLAKAVFGWEPSILPKDGIRYLVEWIKECRGLFGKGR